MTSHLLITDITQRDVVPYCIDVINGLNYHLLHLTPSFIWGLSIQEILLSCHLITMFCTLQESHFGKKFQFCLCKQLKLFFRKVR